MSFINIRGVNCAIAGDHDTSAGITRRWTEYGPEIIVRFMCAWSDTQNLAAALLGSVALNDDGSLARIPPYNLPFAPKLYCTSVGDERPLNPSLDPTGWVFYAQSEITAVFGALTWQIDGGEQTGQIDPSGLPYTTTKFRVSHELLQPPKGYYFVGPFGSGAKDPNEEALIGYVSTRVEISMSRHWQPRIPLDEAMSLIATINDDTIQLANRTFPRGTLLFAGLTNEPRNDPNGYPVQELEYTFLGKFSVEWNEFLDPVTKDYQFLNTAADGTGDFPYEYVDFSPLFT
jgi:hypothetical protein